jgi:ElaB/YqjD/DUF883 family membrane-anchored ribosome-binding protein
MTDHPKKTPAEAERDIDHTRTELSRTLDALEMKLNARTISEKGFDMFRESIDQAMNRGIELVRANPVPAAMIGIGAVWMAAASTGAITMVAEDERVRMAGRKVADMAGTAGSRAGEFASGIAGRALGHGGEEAGQQVSGWIHQATDRAQGAISRTTGSANQMAGQITNVMDRHPLVVGGVAMATGALIAALLPLSRFEHEMIGNTREELWQKAQHASQEAANRMRDAASRAASRAVDAAADAAAETVREEIRDELGNKSPPG